MEPTLFSIQPNTSLLDKVPSFVEHAFTTAEQVATDIVITPSYPRSPLSLSLPAIAGIVTSVLFIIGVIYVRLRLREIHAADKKKYHGYFIRPTPERRSNQRWEKVEKLFHGTNPSDWRLAILEADAMLDECVQRLGYPGANLGERLKSANMSSFPTLQLAWEAHKTRNAIAHQGLEFHLSHEEAWHTFKLFEAVFRSTQFI